jgi:hypothetical protein
MKQRTPKPTRGPTLQQCIDRINEINKRRAELKQAGVFKKQIEAQDERDLKARHAFEQL